MNDINRKTTISYILTIGFWLLVLMVLAYFFGEVLAKLDNPNQRVQSVVDENGIVSVSLQRNRQGHYVSQGEINGHEVVFMLDTGATTVSVPLHIATELGLKKGRAVQVRTAGGGVQVYKAHLNTVALGDIELNNIRAVINPHDDSHEILLGMTFLKQLEFTQRGDMLTLRHYE